MQQFHTKRPTGLFSVGDRVQLTDPKGRLHTITLEEKGFFNSSRGAFAHRELIGKPEGTVVVSREGTEFLALRPLLCDYVMSMPRGATIIYPKDAAQIIQMADIFPGARVLEAGVGSGGMTLSLLQAVGESGYLHSIERREDFREVAAANVDLWFGQRHPAWKLSIGDFQEVAYLEDERSIDRIVLDMLAPWECLDAAHYALRPGGVLCVYVATVTQMSRTIEAFNAHNKWVAVHSWETLVRDWHVEGLAVRPMHSMVGHTGFLVSARALAKGEVPPRKGLRPAPAAQNKGGQWDEVTDWEENKVGLRSANARKVRKITRDLQTKKDHARKNGHLKEY
ncbi:MAG: tRNA (adenine-N1)-methyltransferase [Actinomycetaceae bacterium]|nr:tRNA (adenine-N1)-methyltransferase [Actinomycetaceae bacterium]